MGMIFLRSSSLVERYRADACRGGRPAELDQVAAQAGERDGRAGSKEPDPAAARAALVLAPGAAEAALDDLRLVAFAEAMTRRGFLVLVPALADDDELRVSAADADAVADALRYLTGANAFPTAGLAALSYAVGPAVVATLEHDLRDRVDFIVAIGEGARQGVGVEQARR